MVDFVESDGVLLAEGHDLVEDDLRAGLTAALALSRNATQAQVHADLARFDEAWHSEEYGFGHDCSQHQDVDKSLWSPGCQAGGFRPVTIAGGVPAKQGVSRATKPAQEGSDPA